DADSPQSRMTGHAGIEGALRPGQILPGRVGAEGRIRSRMVAVQPDAVLVSDPLRLMARLTAYRADVGRSRPGILSREVDEEIGGDGQGREPEKIADARYHERHRIYYFVCSQCELRVL